MNLVTVFGKKINKIPQNIPSQYNIIQNGTFRYAKILKH